MIKNVKKKIKRCGQFKIENGQEFSLKLRVEGRFWGNDSLRGGSLEIWQISGLSIAH